MSVSALRSRSVSSATSLSLSALCMSLPPGMTRARQSEPERRRTSDGPPRLGFRLSAASCLRRTSSRRLGGGYLHGGLRASGFLQLFDDPSRAARVDVDSGPHRARERDGANVAALRGCGLRAHDLVEECGVVLHQLPVVEALLADRDVDVRPAICAVLELARLR